MTDARRNRIVLVTCAGGWGGTEAHTCRLAGVLCESGYRVTIVETRGERYAGRLQRPDVPIETIDDRAPVHAWWRALRRIGADTVVAVKGGFGDRFPALDLVMLAGRRRYVAIEHSVPAPPPVRASRRHFRGLVPGLGLWYWRSRLELRLHRSALDATVSVAERVARRLIEDYGYPPDRVTVVPNGVDSGKFRFDPAAREAARRRWGIPGEALVVGTVARLVHEKALDRLVRAFAASEARSRGARLVIVGEGPEATRLREIAATLQLGRTIVWAGATDAPEQDYPGFDLFAMTSENEGLPYALLEAMASERMPVAMDAGDTGAVIRDGIDGLVTSQEIDAFQRALDRALQMGPGERAAMGQRARERVVSCYEARAALAAVARVVAPRLATAPAP